MISEHIRYAEGFKSQTAIRYGIDNTPPTDILEKMMVLASMIFEPVRDHFNKPIGIASFYRCQKLNTVIGGAENSQHMTGEAIDIDADIFSVPGVRAGGIPQKGKRRLQQKKLKKRFTKLS